MQSKQVPTLPKIIFKGPSAERLLQSSRKLLMHDSHLPSRLGETLSAHRRSSKLKNACKKFQGPNEKNIIKGAWYSVEWKQQAESDSLF